MFCRNCGYACPDGSTHCTQCGKPLPPTAYQQGSNPYQAPMTGGYPNIGMGGQQPLGPRPPSYLVQSILTTLFCCMPFGIVGIVFAAQVDSKWAAGDYQGAVNSSNQAKTWSWVAFGCGLAGLVIYIGLLAVGASQGARFR